MVEIQNYDVYISRMEKSMYDKIFFVDKIFDDEITTFIDFGCANGELIKYVHSFMPDLHFIGYDQDKLMIEEAKKNIPYATFYRKWIDVIDNIDFSKAILNVSSVMHEIYSYCNHNEQLEFWYKLFHSGFKYITFRDMVKVNQNILNYPAICKLESISNILDESPLYSEQWKEFKDIWDTSPAQIMHFLLKYRYKENWDREIRENYIPFSASELEQGLCGLGGSAHNYDIIYRDIYTLPYIRNQIKKDFGKDIEGIPTHIKYIFKKKEESKM